MDASAGSGYAGLLFWFLAIIVLIPLSLWLLKRTRLAGSLSLPAAVKVVGQSSLGPGQRLVIVEVQDAEHGPQTLMLGVTPQQINLVTALPRRPGHHLRETA